MKKHKLKSSMLLQHIARIAIPLITLTFLSSCVSEKELRTAERKAELLETKIKDLEDNQKLEIQRLSKELESLGIERSEAESRFRQAESELEGFMEEIKKIRDEFDKYKRKYRISFRAKAIGTKIDSITLNDGTSLKSIEITEINPSGFKIKHSQGIDKIAYTELPLELQEKYMFSAEEALGFFEGTIDTQGNPIAVASNNTSDPRASLETYDPFAKEGMSVPIIEDEEEDKNSAFAGHTQKEIKQKKKELRNEIGTLQIKAAAMTDKIKRYNSSSGRKDGEAWTGKARALATPLKKILAKIKEAEGKIEILNANLLN